MDWACVRQFNCLWTISQTICKVDALCAQKMYFSIGCKLVILVQFFRLDLGNANYGQPAATQKVNKISIFHYDRWVNYLVLSAEGYSRQGLRLCWSNRGHYEKCAPIASSDNGLFRQDFV